MDGQKRIDGTRVAILATDGFEEVELVEPRRALDAAGAKTTVIAPHDGSIQGFEHHDKAGTVAVDATFGEASVDDFDAILLPGGALNADALRAVPEAKQFVQKLFAAGKPIAVICHGPWILASAGLLKGRAITSYHTIQDDLRNAGARWEDREVVRDGNIVSSRKPDDIPAFSRAMIDLFAEHAERRSSVPSQSARH
jgi:protease I